MKDRGNQIVLGTFTTTFVYCLLVVRAVRGQDSESFVPNSSVTVGVLLALASIAVLIYFIHHTSDGIQAPVVTARAAAELGRSIRATFPEPGAGILAGGFQKGPGDPCRIAATQSGFIQSLDEDRLLRIAGECDLRVELRVRPGHFLVREALVARVWPASSCSADVARRLERAILVGHRPTAEQDVEYYVQQLVEIAARALSPSQNDPFAAMLCVDWLGAALCEAARREDPVPIRRDHRGIARLKLDAWEFSGLVDAAIHPVRQNARSSVPVMIRLLDRLADVALTTRTEAQRAPLRRQLEAIVEETSSLTLAATDRLDLEQRGRRLAERLAGGAAQP